MAETNDPRGRVNCLGCRHLGLDPEGAYCMATEHWDAIDDPNSLRPCSEHSTKP